MAISDETRTLFRRLFGAGMLNVALTVGLGATAILIALSQGRNETNIRQEYQSGVDSIKAEFRAQKTVYEAERREFKTKESTFNKQTEAMRGFINQTLVTMEAFKKEIKQHGRIPNPRIYHD
jgi:hypothetical protein